MLYWCLLIVLYFSTRFFNLLSLPIFNDEAIYLHWGGIMVNVPGQSFFSLFDGKPPLILWNYGIFQKFPIDPLLAGRFVSILFGFITLLGIVEICRLLKVSPKIQFIAGLLYIFNPLALFFDRLALLDSPVSTVFIWVLYLSLKLSLFEVQPGTRLNLLTGGTSRRIILLGLIQGLGLWIKGTTRFFLFLPFIIPVLTLFVEKDEAPSTLRSGYLLPLLRRERNPSEAENSSHSSASLRSWFSAKGDKRKAGWEAISFFLSFLIAQILFLPIRFNQLFPTYSKRESDFLLSITQAISPANWFSHTLSLTLTLTFLVTPLVLIIAFYGFYKLFRSDRKTALILSLFMLLPLCFEILTSRYFLSRYYLFTVIPTLIFCAYGLEQIKKYFLPLSILTLLIPISISISLSFFPHATLKTISQNKVLAQDLEQYFTGWTSGYGVKEAVDFLTQQAKKEKIIVVVRADSGNPEDAMFVYLGKNKNIILAGANRKPTSEELKSIQNFPMYFVSRGTQYLNMENMLKEVKIFKKPFGNEFVGVYNIRY